MAGWVDMHSDGLELGLYKVDFGVKKKLSEVWAELHHWGPSMRIWVPFSSRGCKYLKIGYSSSWDTCGLHSCIHSPLLGTLALKGMKSHHVEDSHKCFKLHGESMVVV